MHFIEGLEEWAVQRGARVYPEVIPAGAEKYPFVAIETNNVQVVDETKDSGPDRLEYDVTVTLMVKEHGKNSGQEIRNALADEIVDLMDYTGGEHNGFRVRECRWSGASPGYDEQRAAYYMEIGFTLSAIQPEAREEYSGRLGRFILGRSRLGTA